MILFPDLIPSSGPPVPLSPEGDRPQSAVPTILAPYCRRSNETSVDMISMEAASVWLRDPFHTPVTLSASGTIGACANACRVDGATEKKQITMMATAQNSRYVIKTFPLRPLLVGTVFPPRTAVKFHSAAARVKKYECGWFCSHGEIPRLSTPPRCELDPMP